MIAVKPLTADLGVEISGLFEDGLSAEKIGLLRRALVKHHLVVVRAKILKPEEQIAFARIFGVPLGYYGLVFYLYMFAFAALLAFDAFSRGLRLGALLHAALGVSSSIYFMYIQLTLIHAFCIYCLISAVLTLLVLIAAFAHLRATRRPAVIG